MKAVLDYRVEIPKDRHLEKLSTVLDRDKMISVLKKTEIGNNGHLVATSFEPHYWRYKPNLNCISIFTLSARQRKEVFRQLYYGKAYSRFPFADSGKTLFSRSYFPTSPFRPVLVMKDLSMICFAFPNDRVLKSLKWLADPRKLRRLLAEHLLNGQTQEARIPLKKLSLEPVRYVPEKRCLLRCHFTIKGNHSRETKKVKLFIKAYADNSAAEVFQIMKELRPGLKEKSDGKVSIPRLKGFDKQLKLVIMREVRGLPLVKLAGETCFTSAVEKSALALATLNSTRVETKRRFDISGELSGLKKQVLEVVELLPDSREQIQALFDYLYKERPAEPARLYSVHGDFYHNQIFVKEEKIYILDFDRFHRGNPLLDAGNFLVQLKALTLQSPDLDYQKASAAFKSVYLSKLPEVCSAEGLKWYLILAYLRLVVETVCLLRPNWPERVRQILKWAEEEAER